MADEVGGICHKWDICYDNELEININLIGRTNYYVFDKKNLGCVVKPV
jgi:hypothetical protein